MTEDDLNEEYSQEDKDNKSQKESIDIVSLRENNCSYFYSHKGKYGVVVFQGILKANAEKVFEKALMEVMTSNCQYIIISLSGVDAVDYHGIRGLATLQKSVRDDRRLIRICGAERFVKEKLLSAGAIREEEFKDSIASAIKGIIKSKKVKSLRSRKK